MEHTEVFSRVPEGKPTGEAYNFKKSLQVLVKLFRSVPCSEFGPLKLEALQKELSKKHVRTQVNKSLMRVK